MSYTKFINNPEAEKPIVATVPQYEHDCDKCIFLGSYLWERNPFNHFTNDWYDLYYCGYDLFGPTIISRFSNDGPDYNSGMMFGKYDQEYPNTFHHPLAEAYRRAKKYNLFSEEAH